MMKSKEVKQASCSKLSHVQSTVSSQQTVKTADGRSRQTTLEPLAAPSAANQVPPSFANEKGSLASPGEHALSTELQDLRDRYEFAYGALPRGRRGYMASWLHGQIQAAQYHIMDEHAATGDRSNQGSVFSTIVTRSTQQVLDLTVNYGCAIDDNKLAQHSPKRQRVSNDTMIMGASVKVVPDAAILELKNEYNAHFGHLPRGRFASTSSWLTSEIAQSVHLKSTTQSIAQVPAPKSMLIPETTSDPLHVGSKFGRKILTGELSTIPASDYSFPAGDKGMTFGVSTVNSVHIKTIAPDGMAARLFGHELRIGCMVINIQGQQLSEGINALATVQAHALLCCILTISVPPDDAITWMADAVEDARPLEGLQPKLTEQTGGFSAGLPQRTSKLEHRLAPSSR
jgi:hypothetical protein